MANLALIDIGPHFYSAGVSETITNKPSQSEGPVWGKKSNPHP
jgi:hypothetical protein